MAVKFEDVLSTLPLEEQLQIERKGQALIKAYTLSQLRKASAKSQAEMAVRLGIGQAHVSRLEKRSDFHLSTLESYVGALGGSLRICAQIDGREYELSLPSENSENNIIKHPKAENSAGKKAREHNANRSASGK